MPNYRITATGVGQWVKGDIITDADLKANPQYGGVARLRDKLGSIEDTTDEPGEAGKPVPAELTTGNPVGPVEARRVGTVADPNATARRMTAGKS